MKAVGQRRRTLFAPALLTTLIAASVSFSQTTDPLQNAAPGKVGEDQPDRSSLSMLDWIGTWGGARSELADQGFELKFKSLTHFQVNARGGRETRNGHDFAGSFELNFYLDFEKMGIAEDLTFFLRGKSTWGGDDSDFNLEKIGSLFKVNQDASAEEAIFVDKWWFTKTLDDGRVEIRLGLVEPVKDLFDTSKIMGDEDKYFLNRMLVRNPTIPPDFGLGAYINFQLTDTIYFRALTIDAQGRKRQTNFNTAFHDEDWFKVFAELGAKPKLDSPNGKMWGHYRAGFWWDPRPKEQIGPVGRNGAGDFETGDWGLFTGFEQMVYKENDDPDDDQGLIIGARYGYSRGDVNRLEHFWSIGTQYRGPIHGRDEDFIGFGIGQGILSDEYRQVSPRADRETVYELYYSWKVNDWMLISPDIQYVTNAGGHKGDPHAMIFGVRMRLDF